MITGTPYKADTKKVNWEVKRLRTSAAQTKDFRRPGLVSEVSATPEKSAECRSETEIKKGGLRTKPAITGH
jgi:hypothetical protein